MEKEWVGCMRGLGLGLKCVGDREVWMDIADGGRGEVQGREGGEILGVGIDWIRKYVGGWMEMFVAG